VWDLITKTHVLFVYCSIGNQLRPTLPFKIVLSRISDGAPPSTQNTMKKVHFIRHGQGHHNGKQGNVHATHTRIY
jgi:hypothetical protein